MQAIESLGLQIPKDTKTTTTTSTAKNGSSPEAQQAQTQSAATLTHATFHGPGKKMTDGLAIHTVIDILKAIEHERRGRYTVVDAFLLKFRGKCYACMRGSTQGPDVQNPTNTLFPIIDLTYSLLWLLSVKFLEWTEFPWAEKLVLKGIEDPAARERLKAIVGGSVDAVGTDDIDDDDDFERYLRMDMDLF